MFFLFLQKWHFEKIGICASQSVSQMLQTPCPFPILAMPILKCFSYAIASLTDGLIYHNNTCTILDQYLILTRRGTHARDR